MSVSKCPPNYVRPRVAVLGGDEASYIGAMLALGGYAEVRVDKVAPVLTRRGVRTLSSVDLHTRSFEPALTIIVTDAKQKWKVEGPVIVLATEPLKPNFPNDIQFHGALGFWVSSSDGALAPSSWYGSIVLERLDAEQEKHSKFYDLLSTSEIPLTYVRKGNLSTATWGNLAVNGPLRAVGDLTWNKRLIAAGATREVTRALAKRVKKGNKWAPLLPRTWSRPPNLQFSPANLDDLVNACDCVNEPHPCLDILQRHLLDLRVKGVSTLPTLQNSLVLEDWTRWMVKVALIVFVVVIVLVFLDLLVPSRNAKAQWSYFRGEML